VQALLDLVQASPDLVFYKAHEGFLIILFYSYRFAGIRRSNILLLRFESGVIWPSPSRKHSFARASASANQFIAEKPTLIFSIRHPRYASHSFLVSTDTEPCKARDSDAFGVFQQVRDLSCGRTSIVRPEVDF
jgi:hypothetical protein